MKPREWSRYPFHYDNVGAGMLNLFVVQTFEGWPQILYTSIDSYAEDEGPEFGNRKYVFYFYMIYIPFMVVKTGMEHALKLLFIVCVILFII